MEESQFETSEKCALVRQWEKKRRLQKYTDVYTLVEMYM